MDNITVRIDSITVNDSNGGGTDPPPRVMGMAEMRAAFRAVVWVLAAASFLSFSTMAYAADGAGTACPDAGIPAGVFSDVGPENPHAGAVECAAAWDIADGVGGGRYAPAASLTRGQVAAFMVRTVVAAGGAVPPAGPAGIVDTGESVHRDAIDQLTAMGVVSVAADRRFRPGAAASRSEMVSLLVATYEYLAGQPLATGADRFDDDDTSPHQSLINSAAAAGLVQGTGPRTFEPDADVRRDQMASFLVRMLERLRRAYPKPAPAAPAPAVQAPPQDPAASPGGEPAPPGGEQLPPATDSAAPACPEGSVCIPETCPPLCATPVPVLPEAS